MEIYKNGPVKLETPIELDDHKKDLITRIFTRLKVDRFVWVVDTKNINYSMYKYGPFTFCRITYIEEGNLIPNDYTGYGQAIRSHKDTEHVEAGVNIAFTRAAMQLFSKYKAMNGY